MQTITTIDLDIAKSVFRAHGIRRGAQCDPMSLVKRPPRALAGASTLHEAAIVNHI